MSLSKSVNRDIFASSDARHSSTVARNTRNFEMHLRSMKTAANARAAGAKSHNSKTKRVLKILDS